MAITSIIGECIGTCVINDYLVLFTHNVDDAKDRIYRVSKPNTNESNFVLLFVGALGFSIDNKIQTLPFYENEDIQKVYWIDGVNQTRVINIMDETLEFNNNYQFDFIQKLELNETVSVTKNIYGGTFKSGTIQYALTYFNKNGAESNIFYLSDINYISPVDRAGKPDETISNSFKISVSNTDSKFDYVRFYSIYTSTINGSQEVKNVIDLKIPDSKIIKYIDTGVNGYSVSSDILLYIGGENIVAQCMSQKNNTLFLGNIKLVNKTYPGIRLSGWVKPSDSIWKHGSNVEVKSESLSSGDLKYPYRPDSLNSKQKLIRHFKYGETYRFGVQGQYDDGKWSQPIYIDDFLVDKRYNCIYNNTSINIQPVYAELSLNQSISQQLIDLGFVNIRPTMVPLSLNDRTILAQGITTNTLSTLKSRNRDYIATSNFAKPDYFTRFNNDIYNGLFLPMNLGNGFDSQLEIMSSRPSEDDPYDDDIGGSYGPGTIVDIYNTWFKDHNKSNVWFIDTNVLNFWSPDLIHNKDTYYNYIQNASKISLYGTTHCTGYQYNYNSDYSVDPGFDSKNTQSSQVNYGFKTTSYFNDCIKNKWGIFNPSLYTNDDLQVQSQYPIWSPSDISFTPIGGTDAANDKIEFTFTKLERFNSNYFGYNNILNDNLKFEYPINKPTLTINDGDVFISLNSNDNGGSVLYRKDVEENYPGGTFKNKVKDYDDLTSTLWYWRLSNSGMKVKYNSNVHGVFSLGNYGKNSYGVTEFDSYVLPKITNSGTYAPGFLYDLIPYWRNSNRYVYDKIDISSFKTSESLSWDKLRNNHLFIFDLMKSWGDEDPDEVRYGGKSDSALLNNQWIPCGRPQKLYSTSNTIRITDGDTYIQRFDLLRIYTEDYTQIPSHNESMSFICESFLNLDGRSDVNRYNSNINLMSLSNFGLFNEVYSQRDNYFNYQILDYDRFKLNLFPNTITWSKTKITGELTDTWANITMLNTIDLDGIYGNVNSLNLFRNELYAFQDKAIARLLFNERVQSQVSDGVSLELVNGYKVPDYRYLSNQYGTNNKWSTIDGKSGIYFVDYSNKTFGIITAGEYGSEKVEDLSLKLGFKSWFNENTDSKKWTLSYDRINNDVYIHDDTTCLNYSEILGSFTSFYDYVGVPRMVNVWDNFVSIKDSSIYINNKGDYNVFYGTPMEFYVEYLVNPDPLNDKVFNTFEYRLNNQDIDWNSLELENWYQRAFLNTGQYQSKLKKKFNVNRVQLPRQRNLSTGFDTLNRVRSTWMKMKVIHTPSSANINKKFSMEDLSVTYTI